MEDYRPPAHLYRWDTSTTHQPSQLECSVNCK